MSRNNHAIQDLRGAGTLPAAASQAALAPPCVNRKMGHIPEDTEWFVAELIMEIIVHGAGRNVVHRNLTLVRAAKPEAAFQKAVAWGLRSQVSYQNPAGQLVEIRFRGVAKLDVVIDPIEDGAELFFEELIGISDEEISRWIPPKEQLQAFREPSFNRSFDPDYRSREILDRVADAIRGSADA